MRDGGTRLGVVERCSDGTINTAERGSCNHGGAESSDGRSSLCEEEVCNGLDVLITSATRMRLCVRGRSPRTPHA